VAGTNSNSASGAQSTLSPTDADIRAELRRRKGARKLAEFHAEVVRLGGPISKSHLRNIMSGKREASEVVLRYLGYERRVVRVAKAAAAKRGVKR